MAKSALQHDSLYLVIHESALGLKVRIGQNLHSRIVGTFKLIQSTAVDYRRMIQLPNKSRTY